MWKSISFLSIILCLLVSVVFRLNYYSNNEVNGYNATTYDALGYYMYNPSIFLHGDVNKLDWFPEIDSVYNVSGGYFYQATAIDSNKYAFKYLGGVALMQLPFFSVGHVCAKITGAKQDGFSAPYQYAIIWGALFWFALGVFVLRKVLLFYFSDIIVALTIILVVLASNLLQYVSVDGAMSHVYIFPLYSLLLYFTVKWHETPRLKYAIYIGFLIGLATICRPTELIMVFIPLLWLGKKHLRFRDKWGLVKQKRLHVLAAIFAGFLGVFPQLLYWKLATGNWVYDVGSKWVFFNPWWRVLLGFEKGWFIYTPLAIFLCVGLFFMKGKPYRKAVLTFCLLNIWVVISWFDWRYGASYSARAFTQSYPVFAIALASLLARIYEGRKRFIVIGIGAYLIFVNLFQLVQYNSTVLHYDHMNMKYYAAIYLDPSPSPLDFSLLDSSESHSNKAKNQNKTRFYHKSQFELLNGNSLILFRLKGHHKNYWIDTKINCRTKQGLVSGTIYLSAFKYGKIKKQRAFRMAVPMAKDDKEMIYQNQFLVPENIDSVIVSIGTWGDIEFERLSGRVVKVLN